ncbi:hypothetical protein D5281_20625 [bacterium 1xD42-62]|uniref:Uncharacterized protein n=1 Tax=Parablautia muri TaxID=2320879 RepID=A0A9X5BJ59_9FIRM|nr:hypothetical protein [Parablautia muri]
MQRGHKLYLPFKKPNCELHDCQFSCYYVQKRRKYALFLKVNPEKFLKRIKICYIEKIKIDAALQAALAAYRWAAVSQV